MDAGHRARAAQGRRSGSKAPRGRRADFLIGHGRNRNARARQGLPGRLLASAALPRPRTALTLAVEPGEVFGFLGPERRRQDDHPQAADAAGLPDVGHGDDPRPAARRPRDEAADRLPAREPVLLRLPDRRGAARRYFAGLFGYTGRGPRRRAWRRLLDEVGLGAERRLQLRKFSKGMIQRVGLAQALINDPEVVFLDEPMSGLDPLGRRDVRALILRLRDEGRTVFFSSHILSDAETLCSRIAIVAKGRLMAVGHARRARHRAAQGLGDRRRRPRRRRRAARRALREVTRHRAGPLSRSRRCRPTDPLRLARELAGAGGRLVSITRCTTRSRTCSSARSTGRRHRSLRPRRRCAAAGGGG